MQLIFEKTLVEGIDVVKVHQGYLYRVGKEIFTTNSEAIMYKKLKGEKQ